MRRLLLQWPERDFPRVQQGWQRLEAWLREAEHPWKRGGTAWCLLVLPSGNGVGIAIGPSMENWPQVYDILKAEDFHEVLFPTNRWVASRRHARLAALDGGQGLHTGPDWKVPERLLKKADHLTGVALKTIWQGAVRASPTATCQRCGVPATKRHVLWDCSLVAVAWGTGAALVAVQTGSRLPRRVCGILASCRKTLLGRGSLPSKMRPLSSRESFLMGGPSLPKPLRRPTPQGEPAMTPACVRWSGASPCTPGMTDDLNSSGRPPVCSKAIQFAALHLPAGADVTSDCKGAVARSRKGCNMTGRNLGIFGTAPTEHLDLHWVPSHLTESQFRDKVGPNQNWRRVINAEVDQLVGDRALSLLPEGCQAALEKRDTLATSMACFLGRRMQALWSYDKDQGPQVLFPRTPPHRSS